MKFSARSMPVQERFGSRLAVKNSSDHTGRRPLIPAVYSPSPASCWCSQEPAVLFGRREDVSILRVSCKMSFHLNPQQDLRTIREPQSCKEHFQMKHHNLILRLIQDHTARGMLSWLLVGCSFHSVWKTDNTSTRDHRKHKVVMHTSSVLPVLF